MPPTLIEAASGNGVAFERLDSGESEVDRLWTSNGGFDSFGSYVRAACAAQSKGHYAVSRTESDRYQKWSAVSILYRRWLASQTHPYVGRAVATPDGMYELSEPDGGSVVPPGYVRSVFDKARFRDTPLKRCRIVMVDAPAGVWPAIAETSRVDGSRWGGLNAYWENEAQQLQNNHPKLANTHWRLKKLTAMVPVSDELLDDSQGLLDAFLDEVVPKEFAFKTNDAMINGTGAGQLLGVASGPGTITIAKDPGQATGTLTAGNLQGCWRQSHGASRANMVWYGQEDIDVDTLFPPVTSATGWQGEQPHPSVKGRPFIPLENCQPIGTPGDVILGDWSQYVLLVGGMRKTVSMHFKFDYFESYFKFVWRCDGQPLWLAPLTPAHSTIPKSPFLLVAQR